MRVHSVRLSYHIITLFMEKRKLYLCAIILVSTSSSESDHCQPSYVVSPIFFSWIHPSIKDNLYWATSYLLQSTSPLLSQVILSQQRKSKVNHFLGKNIALHFGCLKYHPVVMATSHLKSMSCYMFGTWLLWYVFFLLLSSQFQTGVKYIFKNVSKMKKWEKSKRTEWLCWDKHTQRREKEGLLSESARFSKIWLNEVGNWLG